MTEKSFEVGCFEKFKRTVELLFGYKRFTSPETDKIKHLDEKIFAPFLDASSKNVIDVYKNKLTCDVHSNWLLKDKEYYSEQVENFICPDGKNIFDHELREDYYV